MVFRRSRCGVAMLTVSIVACGGAGGGQAQSERPEATLPEALTCDGALPPGETFTAEPAGTPARRATQPLSEMGAEGTRLWKAKRYDSSVPYLRGAAGGRGGDDRASRDVLQFRLAVALLLTGYDSEAKALLGVIARDPTSAARAEMLAWLADASVTHPGLAHYFGAFDDADAAAVEGSPQLKSMVNYLLGRQRFEQRAYADAMFFFAQVKAPSRYTADAQRCVAKIDAKTNAARAPQGAH